MTPHETEQLDLNEELSPVQDQPEYQIIKIRAHSKTTAVAGAIAKRFRETPYFEVHAIGISAVNQAVKAVTIAQSYLSRDGLAICFTPSIITVMVGEEERKAISILVSPRPEGSIVRPSDQQLSTHPYRRPKYDESRKRPKI